MTVPELENKMSLCRLALEIDDVKTENVFGYKMVWLNGSGHRKIHALMIDEHYILLDEEKIFGISHTREDADKRLRVYARDYIETIKHVVGHIVPYELEDRTRR
ncbi:hypothetical protein HY484_00300 [Candidatus Woesearchaeota archaeon]|nr:hypothetical protein [Candidatus Woesearchaeota archaeon]